MQKCSSTLKSASSLVSLLQNEKTHLQNLCSFVVSESKLYRVLVLRWGDGNGENAVVSRYGVLELGTQA